MSTDQFRGHVETVDTQTGIMSGWAVDLHAPGRPALLHVLMDGQEIMQVPCDLPRKDIRRILSTPGDRLGFRFALPEAAHDGRPHDFSIRFDNRSVLPFPDEDDSLDDRDVISLTLSPHTQYMSYVDGPEEGILRGWIVSRTPSSEAWKGGVTVAIRLDGVTLGTVRANHYRSDVAQALHCDPDCGFEFPIPRRFHDGLPHEITAVTIPDGTPLSGTPLKTSLADDLLTARLVQIETGMAQLHQQLTALRNSTRSLIPRRRLDLNHYDQWAQDYYRLLHEQAALQRKAHPLTETPLVSVLLPTCRPDENGFRTAIESVLNQTHENWELIIVNDGSRCRRTTALIEEYSRKDRRVRAITLKTGRGLSGATDEAIRQATGRYIMFFSPDEVLVDIALERMVRAALKTGARLLYCDEDRVDTAGRFLNPTFRPSYDYRYLLGCNYIGHLAFMDAETVRRVGPLKDHDDGSWTHDFLLRTTEIIPREAILHVPEILHHRRTTLPSSGGNGDRGLRAGADCVTEHLKRRGMKATVSALDQPGLQAIDWSFSHQPTVSIIIPFRDQPDMTRACVGSLLASQTYRQFDIILVDNFSVQRDTLTWLEEIGQNGQVSILRVEEPFNYARLNNLAARQSGSELLLFLNSDVIITQPDFLEKMVKEMQASPDVGAVGARLLYPNSTIQHAGVAVGPETIGIHLHRLQPAAFPGYGGRLRLTHEVTAVTGAAMLVSRSLFDGLGGFDEIGLAVAYNDVDLCLKIRESGHRIIFCAEAEAVHHEGHSRGSDDRPEHEARLFHERQVMLERWKDSPLFKNDPAYPHYFRQDLRTFFDLRSPEELWS